MVTLFVLLTDQSDGSFDVDYVLDPAVIDALEKASDAGRMDYDDYGCAGGDFSYRTITLPAGCTAESMGISVLTMEDIEQFIDEEDEE
jgi:hypothetical protein